MAKAAHTKQFSYGSCRYSKTSPDKTKLGPDTKILNIVLPFEDALKFSLAVDECVRALNKYNCSYSSGKRRGLNVAVHLATDRITVNEGIV